MNFRFIRDLPIRARFQGIKLLTGCFLAALLCPAALAIETENHDYIGIDQIKPGTEGYCLTVLEGTKIEKFGLKVVSIVRNFDPGRDTFLVIGTDERFKKIGPVKGCSGSPVYIEGKLAGDLAGGWSFSKDPLYMVTPIEDILRIGSNQTVSKKTAAPSGTGFDFSKPIDLAEFSKSMMTAYAGNTNTETSDILLATSLPSHVCSELDSMLKPMGLTPVAGTIAGSTQEDIAIEPGGVITIPIVSGDIMVSAVGTAIEVVDNKVYAFGHAFPGIGYGSTDLPMAAGKVHTVVASTIFSFKLASPGNIVGAIRANESTGIFGIIGEKPETIPVKITIDRKGNTGLQQKYIYNCDLVSHRMYSPIATQTALVGAAIMRGSLNPEHTVRYKVRINIADNEPLIFENISSGQNLAELLDETAGIVAMLMNNPFIESRITSMDFDVTIEPKNIRAKIWSVRLSDDRVKPSQSVDVSVVLQTYRAEKVPLNFKLDIPADIEPGQYQIVLSGGYEHQRFLKVLSPHKFTAYDMPTLLASLKNILEIRRNKLYLAMIIPAGGVTIRQNELPFLPQTKALLMQDTKRTMNVLPYNKWLEKSIDMDLVVIDKAVVQITVEE